MADEQAVAEVETAVEETPEQPTSEETVVSEDANTPAETDDDKGDLRIPLKEERRRRQELEQRLTDPMFIYERAKELGLTEEQAQDAAQMAPQVSQVIPNQQFDVAGLVNYQLSLEKAKDKYPSLQLDEEDQIAVTALAQAKKLSPLEAADKYFAKLGKVKQEAKVEGVNQAKTEITEKERAQTVNAGSSPSSDSVEKERLLQDSRSYNPTVQKNAMIEILKRKNEGKW